MKKLLILLFCISFGYLNAQETIRLFIEDGNNDAYQYYSEWVGEDPVGDMFVDQEILAFGYDQALGVFVRTGLRYTNVPIPPGATIESAFIQFTSFEANPDNVVTHLYCERSLNPLPFTGEAFNISDRTITSNVVIWDVAEWQAFIPGPNQKTPDLKKIVQEVIDMVGWEKNMPIVLLVSGAFTYDPIIPEKACSWEYMGDMYAPVLTINYYEPAFIGELGAENKMSVFPNPASDKFTVSFGELEKGQYQILLFDLNGRVICQVYHDKLVLGDHQFYFSAGEMNLKQGIYLLSLRGEGLDLSQKLILR